MLYFAILFQLSGNAVMDIKYMSYPWRYVFTSSNADDYSRRRCTMELIQDFVYTLA